MATIVTRAGKGSALTHTEMDANFTNLNTELAAAGAPSWKTLATGTDSTERTTNYQGAFTTVTLPSTPLQGFAVVVDCDGKTGGSLWRTYVGVSSNNNWSNVSNIGQFFNYGSTSGYWPAFNTYQNITYASVRGVNGGALSFSLGGSYSTATSTDDTATIEGTSAKALVKWDGNVWGGTGVVPYTYNDAPSFAPSSSFYVGHWFNPQSYGTVAIKNVTVKCLGLY